MQNKKILVISGIVDFQIKGNQTIKQTIKYFAQENQVTMLSFIPDDFPNLDKDFEKDNKNLYVSRMPFLFKKLFYGFRFMKNSFKTTSKDKESNETKEFNHNKFEDVVDYFDNYSKVGLLIYNIAMYIYFILEFPRALFAILKNRPDFIYGYENNGALLASVLGRLFNIKVVKRFQGTPLIIKDGEIFNNKWLHYFVFPYSINKSRDLVVMANDGTRGDDILDHLNVPKSNYFFPINGFVTESLQNINRIDLYSKFDSPDDTKFVVMLSKLKIWKRVDRGLYILKELIEQHKAENLKLIVIGDGEMTDSLKSLKTKLELDDKVIFTGALGHKEALEILNSADMFWSFYDITNLGNPLLESAYLGKPIVTIEDRDVSILFGDRKLYSLNQFDNIVEEVNQLLNNKEKYDEVVAYSANLKSKLISWEERILKELDWINKNI